MNSDSLRGEAMSNSKSRLKTTKGKFVVRYQLPITHYLLPIPHHLKI